jgi:hypothetical protein
MANWCKPTKITDALNFVTNSHCSKSKDIFDPDA